jgi:pimeloyl-ACP methyl ester carboxylesterase
MFLFSKKTIAVLIVLTCWSTFLSADLLDEVEHGYADNDGVKIHYATVGEGPLVVMIHGFPDFWYSWRHQMAGLQDNFKVVAIDQRGYNLSDKPKGVENYAMANLVSDVVAVVRHHGRQSAIIVGHDWGGSVAWNVAFTHPERVLKLVILNLPHPNGMMKVQRENSQARKNTGYAQRFIDGQPSDPDIFFGSPMTPETLAGWVTDQKAIPHYLEAFGNSDFDAMLAYYKMNYPNADQSKVPAAMIPQSIPQLTMPVLIFHGLEDKALHSDGLNNTWDWVDNSVTIVTAPYAGHFVQQDAAELVTNTMRWWLR